MGGKRKMSIATSRTENEPGTRKINLFETFFKAIFPWGMKLLELHSERKREGEGGADCNQQQQLLQPNVMSEDPTKFSDDIYFTCVTNTGI